MFLLTMTLNNKAKLINSDGFQNSGHFGGGSMRKLHIHFLYVHDISNEKFKNK